MDINPVIFPAVTNRESWQEIIRLADADTGDLLDVSGWTFACEVRCSGRQPFDNSGYSGRLDYGSIDASQPIIQLSLGSGISVLDIGQVQLDITLEQMRSLLPGSYSIAMTGSNGTDTRQLFLGKLPVLYGGTV